MNLIASQSKKPVAAAPLPMNVWPCLSDGLQRISAKVAKLRAAQMEFDIRGEIGKTQDIWGDELPKMEVVDGVAIIPLNGVMMFRPDRWDRAFGACDTEQLRADVLAAGKDSSVGSIVVDANSPGGSTAGVAEAADALAEIQKAGVKPVFTYTIELASAAFWFASGSTGIFAPRSAVIGAIGAYSVVYDQSKWFEEAGVTVHVIKSGALKGMGVPGTEITEEQLAALQELVDANGAMFRNHVTANRPQIAEADMQGGFWHAEAAAEKGLIDGIVNDLDDVVRMARGGV